MIGVVTLCSAERVGHVRAQLAALGREPDLGTTVVWVGADSPPSLDADVVLHLPPTPLGLRLAAARNAGADAAVAAGADLLILLDADCVPGPELVARYRDAAHRHPEAVLCGPVTYLPPGVDVSRPETLVEATDPHAARPSPAAGSIELATVEEYPLFWSLSFAMTAELWAASPRFDERFEGYGGEDTDFAFGLRDAGIPLAWVGGAHAYHQHHPTSSPPWQHVDDILRNGRLFADRWGEWPMTGWLADFESAGVVHRRGSGWVRA